MIIDNLYLIGKMFENISLDSVRSSRTCPANLGVRSCPVRKLICPVRLSPSFTDKFIDNFRDNFWTVSGMVLGTISIRVLWTISKIISVTFPRQLKDSFRDSFRFNFITVEQFWGQCGGLFLRLLN